MRRQHKHHTPANLLASKRIAVAFCAAVAMVLGAMSVGATMHFYPSTSDPTTAQPAPTANAHANITTFAVDDGTSVSQAPQTITNTQVFSQQSALTPVLIAPPKASKKSQVPLLRVVPNIVSQTSLTLGPLSVSASVSNNKVELNTSLTPSVDVQVPTSLPNLLPATDPTTTPTTGGTNTASSDPTQTPPADSTTGSQDSTPPTGSQTNSPSLLSALTTPVTDTLQSVTNNTAN